jgi:hypothetical protein
LTSSGVSAAASPELTSTGTLPSRGARVSNTCTPVVSWMPTVFR